LSNNGYFERIWDWFRESEEPEAKWKDVFGVVELDQQPVGIFYLSAPVNGCLAFGNYFGVLGGSRHHDRARRLVEDARLRLLEINPEIQGIAFEAEVPDLLLLESIAAGPEADRLSSMADQTTLRQSLRALSRLLIYQRRGALTLVDADGRPLPTPTPSRRADFLNDPTGFHMLMYYALNPRDGPTSGADADSLTHFVYDELYGDAYGDGSEMGFPGYRQYVASLRSDYLERARGRVRIGKVALSHDVKMLPTKAELQGIKVDL
jgi:hypothetical protein